jgi:sugar transferase (PEP-CTERM system associated)
MVIEGLLIGLSLIAAVKVRFWNDPAELSSYMNFPDFGGQIAIVVTVCLACFYCNDLYDLTHRYDPVERVLRVEQSLGAASLLLGSVYFLFPTLLLSRGVFIIAMILATAFILAGRKILDHVWRLANSLQRVVILGTGQIALDLAREISRRNDLGMKLEGFVSTPGCGITGDSLFGFPVLGQVSAMEDIVRDKSVSRIVVALEDRRGALPTRQLVTLRVQGLRVDDAPTALSALTGRIALRTVNPSWFLFTEGFHRSRWNDLLKRVLDLTAGIIGLLLSLPIMLLVAIIVRLDSKGPVIYRQTRVGRQGKDFEVLKFRSMRVDAEKGTGAQWASENDPRTTRVGKFLRKYRFDELPQFVNVIRGEMSFVGPRPERPCFVNELAEKIPYYVERHSVRPGLTGWAQVQYPYGSSIEDAFNKLEYDLFYLKNMSLTFDLAIIAQTIRIVIGGRGGR